jgi:hypothetical protein
MALENALSRADLCTDFRTCVLDLKKDVLHMGLYRAHPYFTDVLEWLEGIRTFSAIRHNHSEEYFSENVLPSLLKALKKQRLLKNSFGKPLPVYDGFLLRNVPRDPQTCAEIATEQVENLLMRALTAKNPLRFDVVRTLASREQIKEWRRRLLLIFEEIEDHDDPEGVPFTLNMLTLEDA